MTFSGHADYIGCFVDSDPIRKFPYVYGGIHFVSLTIDFCILGCADDGFKYAGMQVIVIHFYILFMFRNNFTILIGRKQSTGVL